jgi:hypothetical protein
VYKTSFIDNIRYYVCQNRVVRGKDSKYFCAWGEKKKNKLEGDTRDLSTENNRVWNRWMRAFLLVQRIRGWQRCRAVLKDSLDLGILVSYSAAQKVTDLYIVHGNSTYNTSANLNKKWF